jgi:predicted DNA-binding protein YlxM (UPF0122 family)
MNRIHLSVVLLGACEFFKLDESKILSTPCRKSYKTALHLSRWYTYRYLEISSVEIGDELNIHNSTVLNSLKKVGEWLENERYEAMINEFVTFMKEYVKKNENLIIDYKKFGHEVISV